MSFRNRCCIGTANGPLPLTVPVEGGRNVDKPVREVTIDNSQSWQKRHWRSIFSAYNHSPWFEFYCFEMERFYATPYRFLWDWNLELWRWVVEKLQLEVKFSFSDRYEKKRPEDDIIDLRNKILPKTISGFDAYCPSYTQVFEDRTGFIPNLSIIDLLFCEGPGAVELLKKIPIGIQQLAAEQK